MSGTRKAHHSGSYHRLSRILRTHANADPAATCWRDGRTLGEHGRGARWDCGHVDDMALYAEHPSAHALVIEGRLCAPEVSGCNRSHGAAKGNRMRVAVAADMPSRDW